MTTTEMIKELRERTGAGMMDCKKAIEETGTVDKAIDYLRAKGLAKAAKKAGREATEGTIQSYIHAGGRVGVLVEINCETDFAAQNDAFKAFSKDVAMQIAAMTPLYLTVEEIPEADVARESEIIKSKLKETLVKINELDPETMYSINPGFFKKGDATPEEIKAEAAKQAKNFEGSLDRRTEGQIAKWKSESSLLQQTFVKNPSQTIDELLKALISTIGENIKIRRFVRFELGDGLEKKQTDFAAEVAAAASAS